MRTPLEAEPLVAFAVVADPVRAVLPVGTGEVAGPVAQAAVRSAASSSRREDVDLGVREVGQPAGVVGVQVGGDDVA